MIILGSALQALSVQLRARKEASVKTAECIECGEEFSARSVNHLRCRTCTLRANPSSYQCPYWYCLEWYIPDTRKPHQHRRLTREQSDVILTGVPNFLRRKPR